MELKTLYRFLANIAQLCYEKGARYVVLSPGSRVAPLALTFLRNRLFKTIIIPDERSAGYVALGIAQVTQQPVVLACTSGTAALNYSPAVAEAFFQNIPFLVLTSDRPPELVGNLENQTIFQENIYGAHVKMQLSLNPEFYENWPELLNTINGLFNKSVSYQPGPVHLNIPFHEPFYPNFDLPSANADLNFSKPFSESHFESKKYVEQLIGKKRILVIAGLHRPNKNLISTLESFLSKSNAAFIPDVCSNLHEVKDSIFHPDRILSEVDNALLKPDLLITFGNHIISKKLKNFLREAGLYDHWHITLSDHCPDPFFHLSAHLRTHPELFFESMEEIMGNQLGDPAYQEIWLKNNKNSFTTSDDFSEEAVVDQVLKSLPANSILHLGNSMPVRNVAAISLSDAPEGLAVFSNRGTSGIDGCLSTAVGTAIATNKEVFLIIGDMSFLYDRNGLWNNFLPGNLKVIILNNHGGRIFEKIPGPKEQPELEEFFVTYQPLRFKDTAKQHGCPYYICGRMEQLSDSIASLRKEKTKTAILEIDFSNI